MTDRAPDDWFIRALAIVCLVATVAIAGAMLLG